MSVAFVRSQRSELEQALEESASQSRNSAFDFEERQARGDPSGAATGALRDLVDRYGRVTHRVQKRIIPGLDRRGGRAGLRARAPAPLGQDLVWAFDQLPALLDQLVAPLRERRMNRAGNRKAIATLFDRVLSRDERAALYSGLGHEHPAREAADQTIATGEVLGCRLRAEREFGHERADGRELVGERVVSPRIDPIRTGAHYRDARGRRAQTATMGGCIDAEREPAYDREAGTRERVRERLRVACALKARIPAADDREARRVQQLCSALHIEHAWRNGDMEQ